MHFACGCGAWFVCALTIFCKLCRRTPPEGAGKSVRVALALVGPMRARLTSAQTHRAAPPAVMRSLQPGCCRKVLMRLRARFSRRNRSAASATDEACSETERKPKHSFCAGPACACTCVRNKNFMPFSSLPFLEVAINLQRSIAFVNQARSQQSARPFGPCDAPGASAVQKQEKVRCGIGRCGRNRDQTARDRAGAEKIHRRRSHRELAAVIRSPQASI